MSEAHIKASKKRWSLISPEERSLRMSELAKTKWKSITPKARRDHALLMVKARRK